MSILQTSSVNGPQSGGGSLCVSLDFELMWGVRDKRTKDDYGANILGGRASVAETLALFEKHGIRATWATVGLLFCESKDEMLDSLPEVQPTYDDPRLSSYGYLDEVGDGERTDPHYFAGSLLAEIRACPGQHIGTHTFSHYYCLEPGQTPTQFGADLDAAVKVAGRHGVKLKSIVFPRHQYSASSIEECARRGITHYRGVEPGWIYRSSAGSEQRLPRRACRLADTYLNFSGANSSVVQCGNKTTNVQSSCFLRPYSRRLEHFEGLRLGRIKRAMTSAARSGETFHMWWHPHNFGANRSENFQALQNVLDHFDRLRGDFGMVSMAMEDFDA